MEAIAPFIFLLIIGLVVVVLVKTAAKRKQRFQLLAQQTALRMSGGGLGQVVLDGTHEGYHVVVNFTPSGKNTPPYMSASLMCQLPLSVTFRPQGIGTALKTAFGLGRDLEIGDASVDQSFEIDAADHPGLRRFLDDHQVRQLLFNLHGHKLTQLTLGQQGISLTRVIAEDQLDAGFIQSTLDVLHGLSVLGYRHGKEPGSRQASRPRPELASARRSRILPPEPEPEPQPEPPPQQQRQPEPPAPQQQQQQPEPPEPPPQEEPNTAEELDALLDGDAEPEQVAQQLVARGPRALAQAVDRLDDYRHRERVEAVLLAVGPHAVPALVAALEDSIKAYQVSELLSRASPPMLQRLLAELGSITDERALTKALEVCTRAAVAGGAEAIEPFLQHESFLVRYEAERALEAIKRR